MRFFNCATLFINFILKQNLDIYIYKNSIKTSDIGLTAYVGDSPTKFEIWFRKRKPGDTWTLQSMNEEIKNTWADEISTLLWKQAKRNRGNEASLLRKAFLSNKCLCFTRQIEIRMTEMQSMGIGSKPCLDIRPSSDQINDRSISFSQLGKGNKEARDAMTRNLNFLIPSSSKIPQLIRRHSARHEVVTSPKFHHLAKLVGIVGRFVGVIGV